MRPITLASALLSLAVIVMIAGCQRKPNQPATTAHVADSTAQNDSTAHKDSTALAADTTAKGDTTAAKADTAAVVPALSYEASQGKYLYTKYCAVCHGDAGKGDGFNAYNLNPHPTDFTDAQFMHAFSDAQLAEAIALGGRGVNKSPLMPSWDGRMNANDIAYVVAYVRTFTPAAK